MHASPLIGFSNIFDMLRWDSIDMSLELLGFDEIFRELIQHFLRSVSFSTLVEGSPTNIIQIERGVKQEDHLSPLLFTAILEYLSSLARLVVEEVRYEVYIMGGTSVESHVCYADDVISLICTGKSQNFP